MTIESTRNISYAGEKGFDPPGQVAPQLLLRGSRLQKKGNGWRKEKYKYLFIEYICKKHLKTNKANKKERWVRKDEIIIAHKLGCQSVGKQQKHQKIPLKLCRFLR